MHPFEEANLGTAPFRVVGWERNVGPIRLANGMEIGAPGQPMGTCDFCGQGIAICVRVKSADGKFFTVGCDCARKVDDNTISTDIDRIKAEIRREAADKKRQERAKLWQAKRDQQLQEERDRNGGLTDVELNRQKRLEKAAAARLSNDWVIRILEKQFRSDFIDAMIDKLQESPIGELSDRCQDIIGDIVAKEWCGKRRGSKAFEAAKAKFWEKVDSSVDTTNPID